MLTIKTDACTFTVEQSHRRDGFRIESEIRGAQLPSGPAALRASFDLLGNLVDVDAREYTWRSSGNGGSGFSGAPLTGQALQEATKLLQDVMGIYLASLRGPATPPERLREFVILTRHAPAAVARAVIETSPALRQALPDWRISPAGEMVLSVAYRHEVSLSDVAERLAALGVDACISEREAYRTRAAALPAGLRELDLTTAPVS